MRWGRRGRGGAAMFREQVNTIAAWFEQWNECEQTVALYSLLKRLAPAKARFLAVALDQSLADCADLQLHEHQANNPGFVGSLLAESKEAALGQLLLHLPLLRPGNLEAKARYLAVVHKVLSHSVETGAHIEEARQLLSYSLIHPAISNEDRRSLTQWLRHLEDRITSGASRVGPGTHFGSIGDSPQHQHQQQQQHGPAGAVNGPSWGAPPPPHPSFPSHLQAPSDLAQPNGHFLVHNCNSAPTVPSQGTSLTGFSNGCHPRVRRSNSLTPPVSVNQASELWSSQDDLSSSRQKPRSFSLSSEHAPPLSPQSSLASSGSGSESHLDELRQGFAGDNSGMRDVPSWLKSLRLHKYVTLFAQMTYNEMLSLTDEKLAAHGVTKGARHKIILSVRKLKERCTTLCQLEKDVAEGGSLCSALEELKAILLSPIKPPPAAAAAAAAAAPAAAAPATAGGASAGIGTEAGTGAGSTVGSGTSTEQRNSPPVAPASAPVPMAIPGVGPTAVPQEREETEQQQQQQQQPYIQAQLPSHTQPTQPSAVAQSELEGAEAVLEDGDIPAQFTRVMGKVCTQLLVSSRAEEEAARLFLRLLDRAVQHEAFSPQQKRRLVSWRLQVHDVWSPLAPAPCPGPAAGPLNTGAHHRTAADQRHSRHRWPQQQPQVPSPYSSGPHTPHNGFPPHLALRRFPPPPPPPPPPPLPGRSPSLFAPAASTGLPPTPLGTPAFLAKRSSLQSSAELADGHSALQRTCSAPPKTNNFCGLTFSAAALSARKCAVAAAEADSSAAGAGATDPEINSRLESLCLSMTEHALGGCGEV